MSFLAYAWLVPALPLLACIVITLTPLRRNGQWSGYLATALLAGSAVVAVGLLVSVAQGLRLNATGVVTGGEPLALGRSLASLAAEAAGFAFPAPNAVQRIAWAATGQSTLEMGLYVDGASAAMVAMVTVTSTLIHLFSLGYMAHDPRQGRFFSFTALFTAAMLLMCLADNLLLFFMAWEVMGLCSYLLIGFWYERPTAYRAAVKAFITTRIGDVLLLIGIVYLATAAGTLQFGNEPGQLFNPELLAGLAATPGFFGLSAAGGIALLLFCGTIGKSAQVPLHVWLPDAMEGPTPVSALIHAATMVAAGVFLVARVYPLFVASGVLPVVAFVGALTALFGALLATAQFDIKRVLAYSTMSQLGFMVAALGIGGWVAAMFHLLTHAFFKALLFLGSGAIIQGMEQTRAVQVLHHTDAYQAQQTAQDMRNMGGLNRYMFWTFVPYMAGYLALVGLVPFAGFWSKDEILADALSGGAISVFVVLAIASFLTAFYMTRQVVLVFFGNFRGNQPIVATVPFPQPAGEHDHGHEAVPGAAAQEAPGYDGTEGSWQQDWRLTLPLLVLALFALAGGLFNLPAGLGLPAPHWLADLWGVEAGSFSLLAAGIATVLALAGIGLAVALYRDAFVRADDADPLERLLGARLFGALGNRLYVDELYAATVGRLAHELGSLGQWIDTRLLAPLVGGTGLLTLFFSRLNARLDDVVLNDGADALAQGTVASGNQARRTATGWIQDAAWLVCAGVLVLALVYLYGV